MRRLLALVSATACLMFSIGCCHTCDVCDDCGTCGYDAHYGVYSQPACSTCGHAQAAPKSSTAVIATPMKSTNSVR